MKKLLWMGIVGGLLASGTAFADATLYVGVHPIAPVVARGMCFIEGPHFHAYAPHKKILYVEVDNHWAFVGDPTEFDRSDRRHRYKYYGHHPVFWIDSEGPVEHYCYITGPHHHWYEPPSDVKFKLKGGVYWYVGAHPAWYKKRRHRYREIDTYYASVHLVRPVVHVTPPSGFVGVVVGPGGVRAGAHVHRPGVRVSIPVPSLNVVVGGGGGGGGRVVHHHHYHGKVKYKKRKRGHAWGHYGKKKRKKRKGRK